jgi:hypothetical protein
MKHSSRTLAIGAAFSAVLWALPAMAMEPNVIITGRSPAHVKIVDTHMAKNGDVSGVIENNSKTDVRDVQVLVRYDWLWNNEFHPGPESQNPGRAYYYTVEGSIPPGTIEEFSFEPPKPLVHRTDGHFDTTAQIAGFTAIQKSS